MERFLEQLVTPLAAIIQVGAALIILLGLSLLVGATFIKTLFVATWSQIGLLAALVAIRLFLGQVFKKIRGPVGPLDFPKN